MHAVRREQRLPAGVRAGDGPGVRVHQRLPPQRRPDGERDHRDVARGRLGESRLECRGISHRLEDEPDHPSLGQRQGIGQVVRRRADQLLPRRHDHGVLQPPMGAQQRGEDRPRVRDQRDRPRRQRVPFQVADRADTRRGVDEAHAAATDQGHLVRGLDDRVLHAVRRPVDDRARVTTRGRERQGRREGSVRYPQQHQVDRVRYVVQRRHARLPQHLAPGRVHEVDAREPGAPQHLGRQPRSEGVGPVARADHGHGAGAHHRPQARRRSGCHRLRRLSTRRGERRADRASARAALAACIPGMPQTPPPAWVADEA